MTLNSILEKMTGSGAMSPLLAGRLKGLDAERPFSVYRELQALLYLGALLIAAGLAATVKKYFDALGPFTVLGGLVALFGASVAYCFKRGEGFDRGVVRPPTLFFDYVLYLGCVAWGLAAAYAETRFHLFGGAWKTHLLISSALFAVLAYRFDNRLVLSLGLCSLAAWFGLELQGLHSWFSESYSFQGLVFGTLAALAAYVTVREDLKSHFQDVYGNFAAHFVLVSLLIGEVNSEPYVYFAFLLAACGLTAVHAVRARKFFYMVYAVFYGYLGLCFIMFRNTHETGFILLYFILSSLGVGAGLFYLARRFKEEA